MSDLELQKAIVAALKADGAVTALVGTRVYDEPPQDPTYPLIEFGLRAGDPWATQGSDGWETVQTLNAWSRKPGAVEALQIADAVKAVLHRQDLTLDTQQFVMGDLAFQNTIPQADGKTTLVAMRFRFRTQP